MDELTKAYRKIAELERDKVALWERVERAESAMEIWSTRYHALPPSPIPQDTVFCGGVGGGLQL